MNRLRSRSVMVRSSPRTSISSSRSLRAALHSTIRKMIAEMMVANASSPYPTAIKVSGSNGSGDVGYTDVGYIDVEYSDAGARDVEDMGSVMTVVLTVVLTMVVSRADLYLRTYFFLFLNKR
ncbi:hypothetical protein EKPV-NSW-ORF025 [Eastern grey kangaroopox virus]|uniref:Uncharacterized protein n=1 Tax=Eastern grey kangaroopox virus TaxID=2042482 RepID=A0A345Z0N8_9POXV|nr:hypothetical protein EKPV-NSW-ORF025 [Eastern grey kangaroopox virus]